MIDEARLGEITGGDAEIRAQLLTLFIETAERVLAALQAGEDWAKKVHELKGAAANLGVAELAGACAAIEHASPSSAEKQTFFAQVTKTIHQISALLSAPGKNS